MAKSMKAKQNSYDFIEIHFYDHSDEEGDDLGPLPCRVWGPLVKEDDIYYYLMHWETNYDPFSDQTEYHAILKAALIEPVKYIGKVEKKG